MIRGEDTLMETPLALSEIIKASSKMGIIKEEIESISLNVWNNLLKPLWKIKKIANPQLFQKDDQSELLYESIARDYTTTSSGIAGSGRFLFYEVGILY
jgi:hypothetical protein